MVIISTGTENSVNESKDAEKGLKCKKCIRVDSDSDQT